MVTISLVPQEFAPTFHVTVQGVLMIVFDIQCGNGHVFEGWFADSASFDVQVKAKDVACPMCGDTAVKKALMTPSVAVPPRTGGSAEEEAPDARTVALAKQKEETRRVMAMARAVKAHVEKNFENVGPRFADEARKIHYGDAEKRNIHGVATPVESRELREEGIEFGELPALPELDS